MHVMHCILHIIFHAFCKTFQYTENICNFFIKTIFSLKNIDFFGNNYKMHIFYRKCFTKIISLFFLLKNCFSVKIAPFFTLCKDFVKISIYIIIKALDVQSALKDKTIHFITK